MQLASPQAVISYWFGDDERLKYRTKWFAGGGAGQEAERLVDEEVTRLFGDTLEAALAGELESWRQQTQEGGQEGTTRTRRSSLVLDLVALIVLLDQFSRHVFRHRNVPADAPERRRADELGLSLAEDLTSRPSWDEHLSLSQYVFSLMPFRHSANVELLDRVMHFIEKREALHDWNVELLSRFRKQTARRLQHLQDRAKAEIDDDILERAAFVADESEILREPLVQTVLAFLQKHHDPVDQLQAADDASSSSSVIISLSGGVDSMVICKILCVLRDASTSGFLHQVVAMHIDYANRPESSREAAFVEDWCSSLHVSFRKRVVDEVTRGVTDRAIYERVSRDARYEAYRVALAETKARGVIFGHHLGDVQENVISNVMHGCSPLALSGMTDVGLSNGVAVWRPLLQHPKEDIYAFAHKYGVPYFKDTTPSWSTRGKLRTQLVPLLIDMYGAGCLAKLSALAAESDAVGALVDNNIYTPFMQSVARHPCGLAVNILPYRLQPASFWREALKRLMHSLQMSMVRGKAVATFVERIQGKPEGVSGTGRLGTSNNTPSLSEWGPLAHGWLELRKGSDVEIGADGVLVVLLEGVLGDSGRTEYLALDPQVPSARHTLGCWKLHLSWLAGADGAEVAEQRALQQVRDVLPGRFNYALKVQPTNQQAMKLVRWSSLSGGRKKRAPPPPALAGVDLKLRTGLPLFVVADNPAETTGEESVDRPVECCPDQLLFVHLDFRFVGDGVFD